MEFSERIQIQATKEAIWASITNIEQAAEHISGIQSVKILEKPKDSLVGLKWEETRKLFGKEATETMWITEAKALEFYKTKAESHGAVYLSELVIDSQNGANFLSMSFKSLPQTFGAKIMGFIFSLMMKKSMIKIIKQDLNDIKNKLELTT